MAQETREPGESLQKAQGIKIDPTSSAVFVDDAVEGEGEKRDTGACSSKLPVESPTSTDTQEYLIREDETQGGAKKLSELLNGISAEVQVPQLGLPR